MAVTTGDVLTPSDEWRQAGLLHHKICTWHNHIIRTGLAGANKECDRVAGGHIYAGSTN